MVEFFVSVNPPKSTAQMKGVSWAQKRFFEKAKAKDARLLLTDSLRHYAPAVPMLGALEVETVWVFPNIRADKGLLVWHDQKPDIDNMLKAFFDVLSSLGFWRDDKQVARLIAEELRGPETGIYLRVSPSDRPSFNPLATWRTKAP